MAKLGTLELRGASGITYSFNMYEIGTNWKENFPCVYYISKRILKQGGSATHNGIYVGETEDIKERHSSHHKQDCFEKYGYNCISIHQESSSRTRLQIEQDLVKALNPPCND
jgi:hypothetical protein